MDSAVDGVSIEETKSSLSETQSMQSIPLNIDKLIKENNLLKYRLHLKSKLLSVQKDEYEQTIERMMEEIKIKDKELQKEKHKVERKYEIESDMAKSVLSTKDKDVREEEEGEIPHSINLSSNSRTILDPSQKELLALKDIVATLKEERESLILKVEHLQRNQAIDYQDMDLRGALGRMHQEFSGPRRTTILKAFTRIKYDGGEYIVDRLSRKAFVSLLKSKTKLLSEADIQVLSLRFSDGIAILVEDFIAFTRDAYLQSVTRLDGQGKSALSLDAIMASIALVSERNDVGVNTDMEFSALPMSKSGSPSGNVSKSHRKSRPKSTPHSGLSTDDIPIIKSSSTGKAVEFLDEVTSESPVPVKKHDLKESLAAWELFQQRRKERNEIDFSGSSGSLSHRSRGLDVATTSQYKPQKPKENPIFEAYNANPEVFTLSLLAHNDLGYGMAISANGLEAALKEVAPRAHQIDYVSVTMALANKFIDGRCQIADVLKYVTKGRITQVPDPKVLRARARERKERQEILKQMTHTPQDTNNFNKNYRRSLSSPIKKQGVKSTGMLSWMAKKWRGKSQDKTPGMMTPGQRTLGGGPDTPFVDS
jgi:hypothetical protein